jgi:lipopolysaccharide biosynthesis glycosyltransferase
MNYRIAVVYACDANYHNLTLYSLASIARTHKAKLDFHTVQIDYQQPVPPKLRDFVASRGHKLTTTTVAPLPVKGESRKGSSWEHITDAMFHKSAAIQALAPDYDYVLYVDSDILAFEDLRLDAVAGFTELCAACIDIPVASGLEHPEFFANCKKNGLSTKFFNAGVLMANSSRWLATQANERYMEALVQHAEHCPYFDSCILNDQCALNMAVAGDFLKLPLALNVQQGALHTHDWATATMRHYNGKRKFLGWRPWTCDPRQHKTVQAISRDAGLAPPSGMYDFGLSYWLNGIRHRNSTAVFERAIAEFCR